MTNDGTIATGALNIALSGAGASSFTLSAANLASIGVGGNANFTVVPNSGLGAGTYNATVTVSGSHGINESFNVKFKVDPPSGGGGGGDAVGSAPTYAITTQIGRASCRERV